MPALPTIVPSTSRTIVPPSETMSLIVSPVATVISPGSTSSGNVRDISVLNTTTATTRRDAQILADLNPSSDRAITFRSLDLTKATASPSGFIQSVTAASINCDVLAESQWNSRRVVHLCGQTGGQTASIYQGYLSGTVGAHVISSLDTMAGVSTQKNVYTTRDNATQTYVRNTNCWVNADLTPWAAWCTTAQLNEYKFCGMLISPRHLVLATHCNNGAGIFRFVANDNTVVDRTLTNRVNIPSFDLSIGVLNADVPSSISFAKVLPSNWASYVTLSQLPIIAGDQESKVVSRIATSFASVSTTRYVIHAPVTSGPLLPMTETIIPGDSGSPLFTVINGQVVVLGTHYGASAFPLISAYTTEVNANMTFLDPVGGYQLTPIDLSGFNFYA